jgi:hypothetical protein
MKKIIVNLMLILLVASSCTKNDGTAAITLNDRVDTIAKLVVNTIPGTFLSNGENVKGVAKVYTKDGKLTLALEDFSTNNGPDLHVYLSKEKQPVNFIDLGRLKATAGNQLYDISGMPDFAQYKFALIHCQQYNHLFGSAEIAK